MIAWGVLVREFRSRKCRCGREKQEGRYFCKSCYFALPGAYEQRLWIPWTRLSHHAICTLYTRCCARLGLIRREVA